MSRILAELNVKEQCEHMKMKYPKNIIYGFIFDPKDGVLKKLYM